MLISLPAPSSLHSLNPLRGHEFNTIGSHQLKEIVVSVLSTLSGGFSFEGEEHAWISSSEELSPAPLKLMAATLNQ